MAKATLKGVRRKLDPWLAARTRSRGNAMRHALASIFLLSTFAIAAAQAASPGDTLIDQFAKGMNTNDAKLAGAAYTPDAAIIDEFPPHLWHTFGAWQHDAGASFASEGVTDFHMATGKPTLSRFEAAQGYAVVPTTLTFEVKGKATVEKGIFTFAFAKTAAGWRISGWAWTTL
jgi:hypothetical protein